mgnify:CR=1 FL=1
MKIKTQFTLSKKEMSDLDYLMKVGVLKETLKKRYRNYRTNKYTFCLF